MTCCFEQKPDQRLIRGVVFGDEDVQAALDAALRPRDILVRRARAADLPNAVTIASSRSDCFTGLSAATRSSGPPPGGGPATGPRM